MGRNSLKINKIKFSVRIVQALLLAVLLLPTSFMMTGQAIAQTKSLKLYYIHTGEKAKITFKKNGRFVASGLKKINWHLRDWRRNEPTKMDPKLLDLIWEVYRRSGSKAYITVISGYRSPASNNLLRKRGRGVAKNSQHTLGKALDFYLPDVKLSKLRSIGLKMEVGGVGYYPRSGSPFVHLDVGRVRHWPRMSRKELVAVFPKGKTMHVPSDGKPLARYEQAVASYKRRSASGKLVPESKKPTKKELNFFQRLARNTKNDEDDDAGNDAATAPRSVSTTVKTTSPKKPAVKPVTAPTPAPTPTPEAVEPVIAARETEFAALPKIIPVPILAPRQNTITGGEIFAVAALTPEPAIPEPVVSELSAEPVTALNQPTDQLVESSDEQVAQEDKSVPVPARRPNFDTVLAVVQEPTEKTTSVLALNETQPDIAPEVIQVAALTPQEIEDLRALARPTIPVPAFTAPTPAVNVGAIDAVTNQPSAEPPIETKTPDQEVAAIETVEAVAIEPILPIAIEPGTKFTGAISIPVQNPIIKEQIKLAMVSPSQPVDEAPTADAEIASPVSLANLPVPVPRPESDKITDIVLASLDDEVVTPQPNPISKQLPQRAISLDAYSAPQNNSSSIGQWALSSDRTIREFAEVQAPAYGRNIIRQVPGTILVQGFNLTPFGPGQNNFKGKAVTAMRFARLNLK